MHNNKLRKLTICLISFVLLFSVSSVYANDNIQEDLNKSITKETIQEVLNESINLENNTIILIEKNTGKKLYVKPSKIFEPEKVNSKDTVFSSTRGNEIITTEYKQDMLVDIPTVETLGIMKRKEDSEYFTDEATSCVTVKITIHYLQEVVVAPHASTTQNLITKVDVNYQVNVSHTWFTKCYVGYWTKGHHLLPSGDLVYDEGRGEMLLINSPTQCNKSISAYNAVWVDKFEEVPINKGFVYGTLYDERRNASWDMCCVLDL
jgi:hypothetical protein